MSYNKIDITLPYFRHLFEYMQFVLSESLEYMRLINFRVSGVSQKAFNTNALNSTMHRHVTEI